jgi:hypothetical protein
MGYMVPIGFVKVVYDNTLLNNSSITYILVVSVESVPCWKRGFLAERRVCLYGYPTRPTQKCSPI